MEVNINKLQSLIDDYKYELRELRDMISQWEDYDDPGSDPGLQYEQENVVESAYNKVKEFASKL